GQAGVADHHPLGRPRRPRGVDHVGGVGTRQGGAALGVGGIGARPALQPGGDALVVEHQDPGAGRQDRPGGGGGENQGGGGVGEHGGDAPGGGGGVGGQVGPPGLQHPQDRHDQLEAAGKGQGHDGLGTHPPADQVVRQGVGPSVQLGVAERGLPEDDRRGIGACPHLGLEQLGQAGGGHPGGGVVDFHQQPAALG